MEYLSYVYDKADKQEVYFPETLQPYYIPVLHC
jgi:hypothetical protein